MRTVNQPKVYRRVDLPSLHSCSDFGKRILPQFPQEYHLFVRTFGDAACKCVSKKLHEEVDEFALSSLGQCGPGSPQRPPRHFLVIHTMFDDLFDFMSPFFGLFRLLQGFVIKDSDQIVDRTLDRFGRARFSSDLRGGGQ